VAVCFLGAEPYHLKKNPLLLFAVSLRYATRMPLPSGLRITHIFHNNVPKNGIVRKKAITIK